MRVCVQDSSRRVQILHWCPGLVLSVSDQVDVRIQRLRRIRPYLPDWCRKPWVFGLEYCLEF
ncbi:hypothetical protein M6B38_115125 [Iris pallida]|uniref:Uncharacterized protein n=1 Tax=Iris pallida TaxID=29817 RepID=A0AAX6I5P7_IRIPA|nr:hypothetical protein M6B38_223490 [Iris pallida]KAJ6847805.1 hypothetical protein M6B38_115125 [Iris pallida]